MRTTIDIPDGTYRQLKAKAASDGRSVKALLLEAAEQALGHRPKSPTQRMVLPLVKAQRPGSLVLDNTRIYDVVSFP
jgi:hypothetical protein